MSFTIMYQSAAATLAEAVAECRNGDGILLCEGTYGAGERAGYHDDQFFDGGYTGWSTHSEGVLVRSGNRIYLNGKADSIVYEGPFDDWQPHSKGMIVRVRHQLFLNGKNPPLYEGSFNGWQSHRDGVVIHIDDQLLLNGTTLLYEGEFDGWRSHAKGVIVRIGDQFLLNGIELLYEGRLRNWYSHPDGVVCKSGNDLLLNGAPFLSLPFGGLFFQERDWRLHCFGVIMRKDRHYILVVHRRQDNAVHPLDEVLVGRGSSADSSQST